MKLLALLDRSRTAPIVPKSRGALRAILLTAVLVVSGGIPLLAAGSGAASSVAGSSTAIPSPVPLQSGAQLANDSYLTNPGTPLATQPNASPVAPLPASNSVQFTIGFPLRNQQLLAQIINEQETVGNPQYQNWLTLAREQALFGADPNAVQDTINYFTSQGFHVETRGLLSVSFTGSVGDANSAFRTQIDAVNTPNGSAYSYVEPLSLPAPIAHNIVSVNGLTSLGQPQPTFQIDPTLAADFGSPLGATSAGPFGVTGAAGLPSANLTEMFNFTNHAFGWVFYYSHHLARNNKLAFVTSAALDYVYDAYPLLNAGYNGDKTGTPITVAVVMAGGINPDDLREYSQEVWNNPNQILNRLLPTPVDGAYTTNGTQYYTGGDSLEMALDIEYSATMAPGAHIMPVYGPSLSYSNLDDDYATIANMGTVPNVVSNSWGGAEDASLLYGNTWSNAQTVHAYIMLLVARGVTVLASSGDGGGFDTATGELAGGFPATDPYVLSVNGIRTALAGPNGSVYPTPNIGVTNFSLFTGLEPATYEMRIATATGISYESYWYVPFVNYTLTRAPPEASGGFGLSSWFNQSWVQHGLGIPDFGRALGSGVSAESDFNQTIFFDGGWVWSLGGTSEACPTTAGEFGIIDDYLRAHGHSAYLGDGNKPVFEVGNAWENGNLTLTPFYDVTNGTSFWGNVGVSNHWAWPPGQEFPETRTGSVYGNATPYWDFPSGWGTILANNFAVDLNSLESLPGQFQAFNTGNVTWAPDEWANLALKHSYTIHVNASTTLQLTNPHVTVVFVDDNGVRTAFQPALTVTGAIPGYDFTLDTSAAVFDTPGYVMFEFGNSGTPTLGWDYSYVAADVPRSGVLQVSIVAPGGPTFPGGGPNQNAYLGWAPGIEDTLGWSLGGPFYGNTFTAYVTLNGSPVYNAVVTATIPSIYDESFEESGLMNWSLYHGLPSASIVSTIISQSFTNVSGDSLVNTVNVIQPVPIQVEATLGSLSAYTNYTINPMPNVKTSDVGGGRYSNFNWVKYVLDYGYIGGKRPDSAAAQNQFVPNSVNQSEYYNLLYTWQGELLNVSVNDYTGAPIANDRVWLGEVDAGRATRFTTYQPSLGTVGVTNASGTSATTNSKGQAFIQIPQNLSGPVGFNFVGGPYAGHYVPIDMVAAAVPGVANRTSSYTEPCNTPNPPFLPLTQCQYNNSYERNYSSATILVFPDPVFAWTQSRAGDIVDFYPDGSNITIGINVSLPNNDPFLTGNGYNWNPGTEHVVSARACIDVTSTLACLQGTPALELTPYTQDFQFWSMTGNLTGNYAPGIHELLAVAIDSEGHIFTYEHRFIVGSITYIGIGPSTIYLPIPYNLTWFLDLPSNEVSNRTFNQSLEIRYVTPGCGGIFLCPQVVNQTEPVRPGKVLYNQSINRTLLIKAGFYAGASDLPPGQYQMIVWLNANHSGSIVAQMSTFLVFDPLAGSVDGPSDNAVVPIGNVTIAYSYTGEYISNAVLSVYANGEMLPTYQTGAYLPGVGTRAGSSTWTSVVGGTYAIVLVLTTPYLNSQGTYNFTVTSWVNVTQTSAKIWLNGSSGQLPIGGLPAVGTATALALAGAVAGLLVGLLIAPALRPRGLRAPAGGAARTSPQPWEEGPAKPVGGGGNECSICHERFETASALQHHERIQHGLQS
jgi:subtilase family serine protease